jgi:hypothetical protein
MLGFYLHESNYHEMALGPAHHRVRLTWLFTISCGSYQPIVAAAGKAGSSAAQSPTNCPFPPLIMIHRRKTSRNNHTHPNIITEQDAIADLPLN